MKNLLPRQLTLSGANAAGIDDFTAIARVAGADTPGKGMSSTLEPMKGRL